MDNISIHGVVDFCVENKTWCESSKLSSGKKGFYARDIILTKEDGAKIRITAFFKD